MAYEVWSVPSGSLLATYASEAEALADVRAAFAEHGEEYVRGLLLGYEDRRGRSRLIAEGEALVQRALQAETTPPTSARGVGITGPHRSRSASGFRSASVGWV